MAYIWSSNKFNNVTHIINPKTNKSYCKVENNSLSARRLDRYGKKKPHDRRVCVICKQLQEKPPKQKLKKHFKPNSFYKSREWHKLRYQAFTIYGNRCMCCGANGEDGVRLHADHIKPISKYPELAKDIKNLQILCALCNSGKASWDETDWRDTEEDISLQDDQLNHMNEIVKH